MRGTTEMVAKVLAVAKRFPDHAAAGLYAEAQIEVTEMKKRTPVDTRPNQWYPYGVAPHPGQLRRSIHAEDPERRGRNISVTIATGAEVSDYDIYVHENPDAFHPVGQWKFMESVINESAPFMNERLARRLDLDKIRV